MFDTTILFSVCSNDFASDRGVQCGPDSDSGHSSPLSSGHSPSSTGHSSSSTGHSPLSAGQSPSSTSHSHLSAGHSPLSTGHSPPSGLRSGLTGQGAGSDHCPGNCERTTCLVCQKIEQKCSNEKCIMCTTLGRQNMLIRS